MNTGRNDPCPCGSGRKYKHCHMQADLAAAETEPDVIPFGPRASSRLEEDVRRAAATAAAWQVEVVPLAISFSQEAQQRPVVVLVMAADFLLETHSQGSVGGEPDQVAVALEESIVAAARKVGSYPAIVELRHADVADALRGRLHARGISVQTRADLPELQNAALELMEHVTGASAWPPACATDSWIAWGLPSALISELFRAAASFWRAAPWQIAANLQAPRITLASGNVWITSVLGYGGRHFGLVLYSHPADLSVRLAALSGEDAVADVQGEIFSLSFDPLTEVPRSMVAEARRAGWEVASPQAFPFLVTLNTPGGGISRSVARDLITALDAVPRFVVQHRAALIQEHSRRRAGAPLHWHDAVSGAEFVYDRAALERETIRAGHGPAIAPDLLAELRRAVQEVVQEIGESADPDQLRRAFTERASTLSERHNQLPQAELGGLSPEQVHRLLVADWSDPQGAVRLHRDLPPQSLAGSILLFNVRTLLGFAVEQDGLAATEKGNLSVTAVRALVPRLRLNADALHQPILDRARLTEAAVAALHRARIIAGLAGLLQRRKRKFQVTRKGRSLLRDAATGELFALLFETAFRKFNIGYGNRFLPEWPELQQQAGFTLHRLHQRIAEWQSASEIAEVAVLPYALDQAPPSKWLELPETILEQTVLKTLAEFGLLEQREQANARARKTIYYRKSPLLDSFLEFSLPPSGS